MCLTGSSVNCYWLSMFRFTIYNTGVVKGVQKKKASQGQGFGFAPLTRITKLKQR